MTIDRVPWLPSDKERNAARALSVMARENETMEDLKCETCKFFESKAEGAISPTCHIRPPNVDGFAIITGSLGCGEHKPKDDDVFVRHPCRSCGQAWPSDAAKLVKSAHESKDAILAKDIRELERSCEDARLRSGWIPCPGEHKPKDEPREPPASPVAPRCKGCDKELKDGNVRRWCTACGAERCRLCVWPFSCKCDSCSDVPIPTALPKGLVE